VCSEKLATCQEGRQIFIKDMKTYFAKPTVSPWRGSPSITNETKTAETLERGISQLTESAINHLLRKKAGTTSTFPIPCEPFHDPALYAPQTQSIFRSFMFSCVMSKFASSSRPQSRRLSKLPDQNSRCPVAFCKTGHFHG
jgi:hypothetical protein